MKALVLNALVEGSISMMDIAAPLGRRVLSTQASGRHRPAVQAPRYRSYSILLGHEVVIVAGGSGRRATSAGITSWVLQRSCADLRPVPIWPLPAQYPESTLRRPTDAPRLSRNGTGLFQGFGLGGFAERALIHENQLAVVPKEIPFAQAALLGCGVVTGAGSVLNTANVNAGDTVVIFGSGGVGLNAVSGARIAGASRIVVIDIQAKRLDEARRFGATDVIDSSKTKPVEVVRDLLPGGADHVFDFVGQKSVAEQGLAMLGVGGGLYLVGVARLDVEIGVNILTRSVGRSASKASTSARPTSSATFPCTRSCTCKAE